MNAPTATAPAYVPASGRAVAALVLGILGLLACQILSPIAWYLGWQEMRDIRAGLAPPAGNDCAAAGMVLGIIGSALLALAALVVLGIVALVAGALVVAGVAAN